VGVISNPFVSLNSEVIRALVSMPRSPTSTTSGSRCVISQFGTSDLKLNNASVSMRWYCGFTWKVRRLSMSLLSCLLGLSDSEQLELTHHQTLYIAFYMVLGMPAQCLILARRVPLLLISISSSIVLNPDFFILNVYVDDTTIYAAILIPTCMYNLMVAFSIKISSTSTSP